VYSLAVGPPGIHGCPPCTTRFTGKGMTFSALLRPVRRLSECDRLRLSVGSWLASSPEARVILFIEQDRFCVESGLADWLDRRFGHARVSYAGPPEVNEQGMAYINKWFEATIRLTQTPYVSMMATDDIITTAWAEGVLWVLSSSARIQRPIVITPRWEVDVNESFFTNLNLSGEDLGNSFAHQLESTLGRLRGRGQPLGGIEIFSFTLHDLPLNFSRFPPFLAGRPFWDTWLLEWCNRCSTTISFRFSLRVYHLDHPHTYRTKPDAGARHNRRLWNSLGHRAHLYNSVQWVVIGAQYKRGPIKSPNWSACE
jgi:hypothetical protein